MPYKRSEWNKEIIDEVNKLIEECLSAEEQEELRGILTEEFEGHKEIGVPVPQHSEEHTFRKNDIDIIVKILEFICPDNEEIFDEEFRAKLNLWRQVTIDKIKEAIEEGCCCCDLVPEYKVRFLDFNLDSFNRFKPFEGFDDGSGSRSVLDTGNGGLPAPREGVRFVYSIVQISIVDGATVLRKYPIMTGAIGMDARVIVSGVVLESEYFWLWGLDAGGFEGWLEMCGGKEPDPEPDPEATPPCESYVNAVAYQQLGLAASTPGTPFPVEVPAEEEGGEPKLYIDGLAMCLATGDILTTHAELEGEAPIYEVTEICDGPIPEPEEEGEEEEPDV